MIDFTPTSFVNDSPPAITAAELNKIGLAIKALIDGDGDQAVAALKDASILKQNGKLNADIIDDASIEDDMLSDTYAHIYFGTSVPDQNTPGKAGDFYVRRYSADNVYHCEIYKCLIASGTTKVWKREVYEDDLAGKANVATTLAGYGITDAYTKTQVDNLIPDDTSDLTNGAGFITQDDAPEIFIGSSEPTALTAGKRGDFFFYIHTAGGSTERHIFQCHGKSGNDYIWTEMVTKAYVDTFIGQYNSDLEALL